MQLTIKTFPKQRPNITLERVYQHMSRNDEVDTTPNNKEIRLAIELARQHAPLLLDHTDTVRSILQCDISNERINAVKSFKQIIYKKVIVCIDGKHKTVKRLRKRNNSK